LVGPLAGKSIANLINEFRKGNAYVNVHIIQNPNGEIEDKLKPNNNLSLITLAIDFNAAYFPFLITFNGASLLQLVLNY
jgi:hypothetical protein